MTCSACPVPPPAGGSRSLGQNIGYCLSTDRRSFFLKEGHHYYCCYGDYCAITHRATSTGALGPELELDGELLDELPEEVGVAVLGELVEDEPVANLGLGEDIVEALPDVLIVLVANLGERVRRGTDRLGVKVSPS